MTGDLSSTVSGYNLGTDDNKREGFQSRKLKFVRFS